MDRKLIHIRARPTLSNINYILKNNAEPVKPKKDFFVFEEAKYLPTFNYKENENEEYQSDEEIYIDSNESEEKSETEEVLSEVSDDGYELYEEDEEENFSD